MRIGLIGAGRIGAVHAATLATTQGVDGVVVCDIDGGRAGALAGQHGFESTADPADVFGSVDGVVIGAPTPQHGPLLRQAAAAGTPAFCEKPLAPDVAGTLGLIDLMESAGVALQVGFQRRFDPGYTRARAAVADGSLGFLHTVIAHTYDKAPPHADYIPTSGGIFRDCSVHDFDIVRWVTGAEVRQVFATGANKGEAFFAEAGDVDTATAILTMSDDTQVLIGASRYNGAGYDVRMEVHGSLGTVCVGLDDHAPLTSVEDGVTWPSGEPHPLFFSRFTAAYAAELRAFLEVVGGAPSPCTGRDALRALLIADAAETSRAEKRPVDVDEVEPGPAEVSA
jgi:myo-inositol 2-dehydrogenase / D-chiro-inositol 1-dehydrogenase